jgi:LCP family protein required for cell wall assembly
VSVATGRAQAAAFRRALLLVLVTLLLPGAAQRYAGNRRVGTLALRVWLGVLVAGGLLLLVASQRPAVLVSLASNDVVLTAGKVVLALLGAGWLALLLDAWRLGRPDRLARRGRLAMTGVTGVAFLLVAGLLSNGMHLMDVQRDLVGSLFAQGPSVGAVDGRYNVLLLGGDAGDDREGLRPDSISVASVDAATGEAVMIGIPRNLLNAPFPEGTALAEAWPEGFNCGDECSINALYTWAEENPKAVPGTKEPGFEATRLAAEAVTGLSIPHMAIVDMAGFQQIVDALGGVTVDIGKRVPIGGGTGPIEGYLEPGVQELNGYQALWFARSREGASDYERMVRQKCLMTSLAHQADPITVVRNYERLATASKALVRTTIPRNDLPGLLAVARLAKGQAITAVSLVPPLIDPVRPDFDAVHTMVERVVAGEPPVDLSADGPGDGSVGNAGSSAAAAVQGSAPAQQASDGERGQKKKARAGATAAERGLVCQAV